MKVKRSTVIGHAAGSIAASTMWTYAISLPDGSPSWQLLLAGWTGPQVIAAVAVLLLARSGADQDPQRRLRQLPTQARPVRAALPAGRR